MSDPRSIVNQICSRLEHGRCEESTELTNLHGEYVAACREVNERLVRCEERMAAGRRSEAIHLADADPPVLEVVAALDFDQRADWADVALMYDLEAAELIRVDIAEQLEDEYLVNDSLDELMVEHRLLALKRAPLGRRLKVLRKINEEDPQPHWDEDIRVWETRRLSEIEDEARTAYQSGNASLLKSLKQEMSSQTWIVPASASVAKKVHQAAKITGSAAARDKLEAMVERIAEAHAAEDAPRARELQTQWNSLVTQAGLTPDDDLYRAPNAAFAWLAGLDQQVAREAEYARSVATLEQLLETDASTDELKEAANDLVRQGFEPPSDIADRYRKAIAVEERNKGRRRTLVIAAAAVVLAAVGGVSYFLFDQARSAQALNDFVAEAEALINDGLLGDAEELVRDNLEFRDTEQFAAIEEALESAAGSEAAKRREFSELVNQMAAVESRSGLQSLYEQAAAAAFPSTHPAFEEQQQSLESKRQSAADRLDKWAREARGQFDTQLALATDEVKKAEGLVFTEKDRFDPAHNVAKRLLTSLRPLATKLDPGDLTVCQNQISALETRLTKASDEWNRVKKWNVSVDELVSAASLDTAFGPDPNRINPLIGKLNDFAKDFDESDANLCETSAAEAERWRAAIEWQKLINGWKNDPLPVIDAEDRVTKLDEFVEEHANCPGLERIEDYTTLLDSVGTRRGSRNPVETIRTYMSNSAIASSYIFRTADGRRFYAPKSEANARQLTASFEIFRDFKRGVEKAGLKATEYEYFADAGKPAPQSRISSESLAAFKSIDNVGWIETFKSVVQRIERDDAVDPILKVNLLQLCLTNAGRGHSVLATSLEPATDHIASYQWDMFSDWLFPGFESDNDATSDSREKAERILAKLPALGPLFDDAKSNTTQLLVDVLRDRKPVAIVAPRLDRSKDADLILSNWDAKEPHELAVVTIDGDDSVWTIVGRRLGTKTTLSTRDESVLQPGRLVFASPGEVSRAIRSATLAGPERKAAVE